MARINITSNKILDGLVVKAFKRTCDKLAIKMTEIIEREGEYSPPFPAGRDIVDTGALKDSQSIEYLKPTHARFHYDTHYALYVHEGYTLKNGTRQPGRPWTWDSVDELDVQKTFEEELFNGF